MTLPNHVHRTADGRLRCEMHGSSRCAHVREARKTGHAFRTLETEPADPVDDLPDDPTTWTSAQLHTFNVPRRDHIDDSDYRED